MISPTGKLRQTVESAGDAIRDAAENTGRLVLVALALAGAALLAALAALVLVLKGRPAHAG